VEMLVKKSAYQLTWYHIICKMENDELRMNGYEYMEKVEWEKGSVKGHFSGGAVRVLGRFRGKIGKFRGPYIRRMYADVKTCTSCCQTLKICFTRS